MNRLTQFLHYAQKVFHLKTLLRATRDERPFAQIPTLPVLLSLLLGVVVRSACRCRREPDAKLTRRNGCGVAPEGMKKAGGFLHRPAAWVSFWF